VTAGITSIVGLRKRAQVKDRSDVVARRLVALMVTSVAVLVVIGLGAILSASSVPALTAFEDSLYFFKRQLIWAGVGAVVMAVAARVPYGLYRRHAAMILGVAILALVAVLLFGAVRGGSRSWLLLGPISVQPSEFAKFAVVVYLAMVSARKRHLLGDFGHFIWPVVAGLGVVAGLVVVQPDLGTTIIIAAAAMAVLFMSEAPLRYVFGSAAGGAVLALMLAMVADYRWERIVGFLDPFADRLDAGYQGVQSLFALGTGGLFGIGLGASRARWEFLPNAHTDFIFSIIGEETGLVGTLAVLALFLLFTAVGVAIALRARDDFGRLLAGGILAWLVFQALVNLGGVTTTLPITGLPLPFVSFGGSALVVEMGAIGVMVNIARTGASR
jgi:cell division protein FtsW